MHALMIEGMHTADGKSDQHQVNFFKRSLTNKPNATSICLVAFNKEHLTITPEALDLLKSIKKPVAVVGICGPYRSGKSFFMSKMMQSDNEFTVSNHSAKPCTRGIWMSTSVLEAKKYAVILLDTEGIGEIQREAITQTEMMQYLILTTLLCSYLIYNTKGMLSNNDFQYMR